MHRIDHPTRLVHANGIGRDGFTPGDPVAQVAPTVVTADWLNAVQEEIANAIALSNAPLVKGTNNQLAAVIAALTAPAPDAPPEQIPIVDRVSYVSPARLSGTFGDSYQADAGWILSRENLLTSIKAGARVRLDVNIPNGAQFLYVDAAVRNSAGLKLRAYREIYDPSGATEGSLGTVSTGTGSSADWSVISAPQLVTQDKSTGCIVATIEASIPYQVVRWLRIGWRGLATLPDTV